MGIDYSKNGELPAELTASMTGSWVLLGTLVANPAIIIFDNQGTVPVEISDDAGTTTWRTFPAGEALVLDLRNQQGLSDNFSFRKGKSFYGNGASGTFSISYVSAKPY